jgi:hypothetical protein
MEDKYKQVESNLSDTDIFGELGLAIGQTVLPVIDQIRLECPEVSDQGL